MKDLATMLETSRTQFARLYFLSDRELVELLSISRNPQGFLPSVRRCFPGITGLRFALPSDIDQSTDKGGFLDFHLNGQCRCVDAYDGRPRGYFNGSCRIRIYK